MESNLPSSTGCCLIYLPKKVCLICWATLTQVTRSSDTDPKFCRETICCPSFDQDCCLQNYNVISLFLLTNLLNATATIPILAGLWQGPLAQRIVTPASALFGCVLGMVSLIVYGAIQAPHWGMTVAQALHTIFLGAHSHP